ncbi:MAG: hypothetical protein FWG87_08595 [Defluviitaleaceae bacterium]|nr:hypothetical protein [Defluviitaleaceae bacterium]
MPDRIRENPPNPRKSAFHNLLNPQLRAYLGTSKLVPYKGIYSTLANPTAPTQQAIA